MSIDTEAAIDHLIEARAALTRLGGQGNDDYHEAMRRISFAVDELGLSTTWLNEMANARNLFHQEFLTTEEES